MTTLPKCSKCGKYHIVSGVAVDRATYLEFIKTQRLYSGKTRNRVEKK